MALSVSELAAVKALFADLAPEHASVNADRLERLIIQADAVFADHANVELRREALVELVRDALSRAGTANREKASESTPELSVTYVQGSGTSRLGQLMQQMFGGPLMGVAP